MNDRSKSRHATTTTPRHAAPNASTDLNKKPKLPHFIQGYGGPSRGDDAGSQLQAPAKHPDGLDPDGFFGYRGARKRVLSRGQMPLAWILEDADLSLLLAEKLTLRHLPTLASTSRAAAANVREVCRSWRLLQHEKSEVTTHHEIIYPTVVPPEPRRDTALSFLPEGDVIYHKPNGYKDMIIPARNLGHDDSTLSGTQQFVSPMGIAFDEQFVYTTCGTQIEKLRVSDGRQVARASLTLRTPSGADEMESSASSAALSPDGRWLLVIDAGMHRVVQFSSERLVRTCSFAGEGTGPGQLSFPEGCCCVRVPRAADAEDSGASSSRLYVADCFNHRINVWPSFLVRAMLHVAHDGFVAVPVPLLFDSRAVVAVRSGGLAPSLPLLLRQARPRRGRVRAPVRRRHVVRPAACERGAQSASALSRRRSPAGAHHAGRQLARRPLHPQRQGAAGVCARPLRTHHPHAATERGDQARAGADSGEAAGRGRRQSCGTRGPSARQRVAASKLRCA